MRLMSNAWTRAFAAALVLAAAACSDRLVAPTGAPAAPRLDAIVKGFAALPAPRHGDVTVSAVIDQRGGILDAPTAGNKHHGYMLAVPPSTVSRATTFTLRVVGGEAYELELTAAQGGKDVGGKLRHAVTLTISLGDAPSGKVPRTARIYYLPPQGPAQAMPSLALPAAGFVVGVLPHFSRYSVGIN